jgi:hypothetical protein
MNVHHHLVKIMAFVYKQRMENLNAIAMEPDIMVLFVRMISMNVKENKLIVEEKEFALIFLALLGSY